MDQKLIKSNWEIHQLWKFILVSHMIEWVNCKVLNIQISCQQFQSADSLYELKEKGRFENAGLWYSHSQNYSIAIAS